MQDPIKILIAGDDSSDRLSVRQALQKHHAAAVIHEISACSHVADAISLHSFDFVVLDNTEPAGEAMKCLIELRESGATTPTVLLTARDDEDYSVETGRSGATVYLPKHDLTPQLLDHCLRNALLFQQAQEQTLRVQAELRLRDRAIAAASNGIIICDPHQPDCPIVYCNPAFTAITGYQPSETIGRNCRFLQGEGTDPQYIDQIRQCVRREIDCQIVVRNYKKDGTLFWNELTISPVRDSNSRLTHFIGVQTDITERRIAEEALQQNVIRQQKMLRDVFASVTEGTLTLCAVADELPQPLTPFEDTIHLSAGYGVRDLRRSTVEACRASEFPEERRDDLEAAVGEAAMNAVVHSGSGIGRVFISDHGTVQVRVDDEGNGIAVADLPNATLRRGYSTAGTMGHGFKMILRMVDRVYLLTSGAGTTVVLEQEREPPLPEW